MATADVPGANPDPLELARKAEAGEPIVDDDEVPTFWFAHEIRRVVDGVETVTPTRLPFRLDEVTPRHVRRLREVTATPENPDGWTTARLYRAAALQNDIDAACLMWWLTRQQNGEPGVTLDECEAGVTNDHYPVQIAGPPEPEDRSTPKV